MTTAIAQLVFENGEFVVADSDLTNLPNGTVFDVTEQGYLLSLPEKSNVTIFESHKGSNRDAAINCTLRLASGAKVEYLKWQGLSSDATLNANLLIEQYENTSLSAGFFSIGAESEYQSVKVQQLGASANTDLYGFCEPKYDGQVIHHDVDLVHAAPNGSSDMFYKGILTAKSKATFRGRVKALKEAPSIKAHQANHYLLLSKDAEAHARPELEIYQEDIECSHGATVGQLDEAALFYLRSRGIDKISAEKILQRAFVGDVLKRVPESLHSYLREHWRYLDEL